MFVVFRYRACHMLGKLVSESYPKYYREKFGPFYIYSEEENLDKTEKLHRKQHYLRQLMKM